MVERVASVETPAVTVIILASNDGVVATIESVLAQDYFNFSCAVVEDETIVDFARVTAPYRAERRLSIFPRSSGYYELLSDAWRQATSGYVAIACSGDSFQTNWLTLSVEFLEANPETIVGYPDWNLVDRQGGLLQAHTTGDYDFYKMVIDPNCMPGPGALIRTSAIAMPTVANCAFRLGSGYELWLLLALQGDFIHIPVTTALRRQDSSELKERIADYCRASDTLFRQPGLPKVVRNWRQGVRVNVMLFYAKVLAAHSPWAAARLMALAFSHNPRGTSQTFLQILADHSRKLTRFGIPASVCEWIATIARRSGSALQK